MKRFDSVTYSVALVQNLSFRLVLHVFQNKMCNTLCDHRPKLQHTRSYYVRHVDIDLNNITQKHVKSVRPRGQLQFGQHADTLIVMRRRND